MASVKDYGPQLNLMLEMLDRREKDARVAQGYMEGNSPIPRGVRQAKLTKAYEALMGMATAPWASLSVDSVQDRLEVGGIRTGTKSLDDQLWALWRANALEAESKLGHHSALTDGRVYATVWPDADTGEPEVVLDPASQMVVLYVEGRHRTKHRVAALRRWKDDGDKLHCTLYRKDELVKLSQAKEGTPDDEMRVSAAGVLWEPRVELAPDGMPELWPLPNPFNVVPVVEVATNRRLKPGPFPYARGEFTHCMGLLDRINLLTFLGLVVAVWMGFPLRWVVGDKIFRDDDGNPIAPFDSKPDQVFQTENPDARLGQLEAADRSNLSVVDELGQFAYITKTPAHYFPGSGGIANISADAVRALEGGLHAKVDGIHKPQLGGGWLEVERVLGLMSNPVLTVPPTAELFWRDKQSRSLAEAADAATKLQSIGVPVTLVAETALGWSQDMINRLDSHAAQSALSTLVAAANTPAAPPMPMPPPARANGAAG